MQRECLTYMFVIPARARRVTRAAGRMRWERVIRSPDELLRRVSRAVYRDRVTVDDLVCANPDPLPFLQIGDALEARARTMAGLNAKRGSEQYALTNSRMRQLSVLHFVSGRIMGRISEIPMRLQHGPADFRFPFLRIRVLRRVGYVRLPRRAR